VIWTTWRQHRPEALVGLATLVAAAALVFVADWVHALQSGNATNLASAVQLSLAVLPVLAGMFVGAPLLARELEQGTHRLVWTQGTTRRRWLAVKLVLVVAAVVAGAALLTAYFTVVVNNQHVTLAGGRIANSSNPWLWFDEEGPAFVGYTAFALALGIAAGAVIGRSYPAMAVTLVGYVAARLPIAIFARPNYLPPLRLQLSAFETFELPHMQDAMEYPAHYQDAATGRVLSLSDVTSRLGGPEGALAPHGIVGWANYQPGDRFFLFQGIETAIFAGLAALLLGLAYYWTTRRVT